MMLGGNDTRHIPLGDSGTAAIVVSVQSMSFQYRLNRY